MTVNPLVIYLFAIALAVLALMVVVLTSYVSHLSRALTGHWHSDPNTHWHDNDGTIIVADNDDYEGKHAAS